MVGRWMFSISTSRTHRQLQLMICQIINRTLAYNAIIWHMLKRFELNKYYRMTGTSMQHTSMSSHHCTCMHTQLPLHIHALEEFHCIYRQAINVWIDKTVYKLAEIQCMYRQAFGAWTYKNVSTNAISMHAQTGFQCMYRLLSLHAQYNSCHYKYRLDRRAWIDNFHRQAYNACTKKYSLYEQIACYCTGLSLHVQTCSKYDVTFDQFWSVLHFYL